jgi:hypothetical protein
MWRILLRVQEALLCIAGAMPRGQTSSDAGNYETSLFVDGRAIELLATGVPFGLSAPSRTRESETKPERLRKGLCAALRALSGFSDQAAQELEVERLGQPLRQAELWCPSRGIDSGGDEHDTSGRSHERQRLVAAARRHATPRHGRNGTRARRLELV